MLVNQLNAGTVPYQMHLQSMQLIQTFRYSSRQDASAWLDIEVELP